MKRQNLELLLAWLDALRRRDLPGLSAVLDPQIVWQGLRADLRCAGPEAVVDGFVSARDEGFEIDALELIPGPAHVVLGIRRADLHEFEGIELAGAIYNVFSIAGGKITRIEDHADRGRALASAGLALP